jgi:hypothetical protein
VLDGYYRNCAIEIIQGVIAMRSKRALLIAAASLLFVPAAILAHHGLETQFDTQKTTTVTGVITKIYWSSPHVRFLVEVKDTGNPASWELYMGSPNQQMLNGWKIDTYRPGDHVSIVAYPAKDGSNVGYAKEVTTRR